jgi:mannose-6-phosphate isomerase-like protein (cupin superfamily)
MRQKPFEIMRWESPNPPTLDFLTRMMAREGLRASQNELPPQSRSPEVKFDQTVVMVLVSGHLQYAFPGYGVIDVDPGDILEINPGVLHDITVSSSYSAILLEAFRD